MSSTDSHPQPVPSSLPGLSLRAAADLLRGRALSPVELTESCLARIERLDPALNCFITVTGESALEQARAAEAEICAGNWKGLLHGIPLALKDLIDTAGVRTTAASNVFATRVPERDAEVVRRLRAAGAVLLGKLNLHEFAYGGSGVVSAFGPVRNPWNPAHITGGSSSGSAAAVAAGMCYGSIATDTAGSIRLPAAYCGVAGLKPSYGRVSTRGVAPLAWSYDHVGPIARTVADTAAILQAIAGYDADDINSHELPAPADPAAVRVSGLRAGVAREYFFAALELEIEECVNAALQVIEELTGNLHEVTVPVDVDRTVANAEDYAFHRPYVERDSSLYQPETLRRLLPGAQVTAAAYIEKRRELEMLRRRAPEIFRDCDVLVTPAAPVPPPSFAELAAEPGTLRARELLMLRNTRPFNVLGLPAISVPCGFTSTGLPVGLQIVGPPGREEVVLALAAAYEAAAEWHQRKPPVD